MSEVPFKPVKSRPNDAKLRAWVDDNERRFKGLSSDYAAALAGVGVRELIKRDPNATLDAVLQQIIAACRIKEPNMNYPDIEFRREASKCYPTNPAIEALATGEDQVKHAEVMLARAKELAAAEARRQAEDAERGKVADRITREQLLADATRALLVDIHQLLVAGAGTTGPRQLLALHIKELQPLAKTYGVKIVKVGDGSTATITKV